MRVEPFTVGSYVHIVKRGARGLEITKDEADKWRFLRVLFYMNDEYYNENWMSTLASYDSPTIVTGYDPFARPSEWPTRKPLVKILCYTLMSNHIHILVKEITKGGVSKFMQKLGMSMSKHFNDKYQSRGSIFQGGYRGRTVSDDEYLRYVAAYIMVKNTSEMYPDGGLTTATKNFDAVWQWAIQYEFSSLSDYCGTRKSVILDKDILGEIFEGTKGIKEFRSFAKDVVLGGKWKKEAGGSTRITKDEYSRLAVE